MTVIILSAFLAVCMFITSILLTSTLMFSRKRKKNVPEELMTIVSIMKPVKNADIHFEENIRSFYEQDYPDFEILFGLETVNEPETDIIYKVAGEYPHIKTTIVYTGTDKELNPKVDNLVKMERLATGTHYWIADANVIVEKDTLTNLMSEALKKNSCLVFSPILGSGSRTFGSLMENMHLTFSVSGCIISAWTLAGRQITVGKSMLVERNTLEKQFGGFSYFLKYLAEDYMMGRKYEKRGLKVSTNFTWVTNINSDSTIKSFFSRMTRWNTMRYNIDLKYYLAEVIFLNPSIYSILAILTFNRVLILSGLATILFKLFAEFVTFISLNRKDCLRTSNLAMFLPSFFVKESVLFTAFLIPFFSKTVRWRGRNIKVGKNSIINYDAAGNVQFADEI